MSDRFNNNNNNNREGRNMMMNSNNGGQWKTLTLDLNDAQNLVCALVVCRLKQLGWSPEQIDSISDKATRAIGDTFEDEDILGRVAADASMMASNGVNRDSIKTMASAVFAIEGMRVADGLHKILVAQCN